MTDEQTIMNAYCNVGARLVEQAVMTVRKHLTSADSLSPGKLPRKRDRAAQAWAWLCGCHSDRVGASDCYAVGGLTVGEVESELFDEFIELNQPEFEAVYLMAANEFAWA